jgi:hypothetical protein
MAAWRAGAGTAGGWDIGERGAGSGEGDEG